MVGAIAVLLVALAGCERRPEARMAPDFMLADLAGNRFYLSALRDTVVLLNFWSVRCAPCLKEMPLLQKLAETYADKPVRVVGICASADNQEHVASLLKKLGVDYTVLNDPRRETYKLYEVHAEPTTVVIDRNGRLRHRTVGYREGYVRRYDESIARLLHERP
jgi:peroxiredoxin